MEKDLNDKEIKAALARVSDFGYFGDNPKMFKTWSIGPIILTRDSGILEKSNFNELMKALEGKFLEGTDYDLMLANHWAVGWVKHLNFKVLEDNGKVTEIARFLKGWFAALKEYPIASEYAYSEMELEETYKNIRFIAEDMVKEDIPNDWEEFVWQWFYDNNQSAIENRDDQGGYPSDKDMMECLEALGYLKERE